MRSAKWPRTVQNDWRDVVPPSSCNASHATYSSYFFVFFLQQLVIYQLLAIYDVFCIVSCLVSFNIITLFPIS